LPARAIVVVLVVGLLAFQVVRTAAVRHSPEAAAALWPGHPDILTDLTMAEVGAAAARGGTLSPALLRQVSEIARKSPLSPEPFLIHGALAQLAGRDRHAERLYLEALARNPRSPAARYFLADRYLRTERVPQALGEIAVLSRLTVGAAAFAPALATYAKTPGAVPELRRFFRMAPEFEAIVLGTLATDPKNYDLILALWSGRSTQAGTPEWQTRIVGELIDEGDFAKAYSAWRRLSGVEQPSGGLFNAEFKELTAPPPFNWSFGSAGGLADPAGGGRLEVIYFGREDAVLAEQLILLQPGRYALSMDVSGDLREAGDVAWTLDCVPKTQTLMRLPVRHDRSTGRLQASFSVPPGCPAQRLRLAGQLGEFPKATEFSITKLELTKAGGR